jgi:hypothetical protein
MMSPEAKQRIQLALLLAFVVAGVRAGYIVYERHGTRDTPMLTTTSARRNFIPTT